MDDPLSPVTPVDPSASPLDMLPTSPPSAKADGSGNSNDEVSNLFLHMDCVYRPTTILTWPTSKQTQH
jgi:hypothetical protein